MPSGADWRPGDEGMARFGIYMGATLPLDQLTELAQLAEQSGFDGWFCTEHHQQAGIGPSPLVTLAGLAGRTETLKLGTAVLLPPLYHPVRLATDAAVLDRLSGGRFIMGAGLGYQPVDFDAFGVPIRNRISLLEESIEIVKRAWTEERFSFHGRRFHLDDVHIEPRPHQSPRPPIWMAGWTEPGVRRAARLGDAWLTDPILSLEAVETLAKSHTAEAAASGTRPGIVLMRSVGIGATREEALATYGAAAVAGFQYYWRNNAMNAELEPWLNGIHEASELNFDNLAPGRIIWGSPDDCIAQVREWFTRTGSDYLILSISPNPSPERWKKLKRGIELFGREVIPAFR
jgi:probable F420-dependent oxidoreductase